MLKKNKLSHPKVYVGQFSPTQEKKKDKFQKTSLKAHFRADCQQTPTKKRNFVPVRLVFLRLRPIKIGKHAQYIYKTSIAGQAILPGKRACQILGEKGWQHFWAKTRDKAEAIFQGKVIKL